MTRAAWLTLPLIGCGAPDAPELADGIVRRSYAAEAGLGVSTLVKGDPAGQRVIFVHGTPGSADGWRTYLADAPPGLELIAVDRPGFGRTTPAAPVTSLQAQAAALAQLLVPRRGRWPVLVGHSLGGPIVAQAALDYQGRVGGLVIVAGSFDPALEHVYMVQQMGEWPGIRALLPRAWRHANLELMALEPQLARLAPRLRELRCPVAIVHGTADRNVPFANVDFLRARLPGRLLSVTALPGRNHFIPWSERPVIEAAVRRVLEAQRPC